MIMKNLFSFFLFIILIITGCIKETYNMDKLSDKMHFSPTLAMAAATGDIFLSDIVKSSDTVVFDQYNFVKIIFKKDSVFNLGITDFHDFKNMIENKGNEEVQPELKLFDPVFYYAKGKLGQQIATIDPDSLDFKIEDILSKITGIISISNPTIKIIYSNSFTDSIDVHLIASGKRKNQTINLDLAPFTLAPTDPGVTASFKIDSSNSSVPEIMSLPPEKIYISGTAMKNTSKKNSQIDNYVFGDNQLIGSLEIEVPLEFRMKNLQFTETVDNFLKSKDSGDSQFNPEDMDLFRLDISAKNGFPLGASLKLMLFDSLSNSVVYSVNANDIIKPAPVDTNGKVSGITESAISIEFTKDFFEASKGADKIIFVFTLNTTGEGTKDVKIYSTYSISFKASVVVKPNLYFK
jgi:hypothetical protein